MPCTMVVDGERRRLANWARPAQVVKWKDTSPYSPFPIFPFSLAFFPFPPPSFSVPLPYFFSFALGFQDHRGLRVNSVG